MIILLTWSIILFHLKPTLAPTVAPVSTAAVSIVWDEIIHPCSLLPTILDIRSMWWCHIYSHALSLLLLSINLFHSQPTQAPTPAPTAAVSIERGYNSFLLSSSRHSWQKRIDETMSYLLLLTPSFISFHTKPTQAPTPAPTSTVSLVRTIILLSSSLHFVKAMPW